MQSNNKKTEEMSALHQLKLVKNKDPRVAHYTEEYISQLIQSRRQLKKKYKKPQSHTPIQTFHKCPIKPEIANKLHNLDNTFFLYHIKDIVRLYKEKYKEKISQKDVEDFVEFYFQKFPDKRPHRKKAYPFDEKVSSDWWNEWAWDWDEDDVFNNNPEEEVEEDDEDDDEIDPKEMEFPKKI
jgi:hypothetical protein